MSNEESLKEIRSRLYNARLKLFALKNSSDREAKDNLLKEIKNIKREYAKVKVKILEEKERGR